MSMTWGGDLLANLRAVAAKAESLTDDMADGAEAVLADALQKVPKESGDLAGSGRIDRERGGDNAVGITFDGPYARWIHEHLYFKHPRGGQAKFLEAAQLEKGAEAMNRAAKHFWGRL